MKRKADDSPAVAGAGAGSCKKTKKSLSAADARKRFRAGLFDKPVLEAYTAEYAASAPYKHAVIRDLVDDRLLRDVREEIRRNVQFTPKETDIYKIHQSGDLANLDGLDDASLAKLPSLLALRDAVYSDAFRDYVSAITGCGPLSGRKTDMAINVYTPGCFLLCHDDVIGSRRVSYILYLTDPDTPWQPEWGGALRLFPVQEHRQHDGGAAADGETAKTPLPDVVKVIPPAWNQLSFFAVQPGESFHDVQEVYHADTAEQLRGDSGRVRMAISGWFHIPQIGEDGYVEGEEERNARNSGLMQLQGNPAQYDEPHPQPVRVALPAPAHDEFDEADLEFLLRFIAPTYLTPNTLEQIRAHFEENASISLAGILSARFAERLRACVTEQEAQPLPADSAGLEAATAWRVARPPHKHRYLYQRASELRPAREESPLTELLDVLLPSRRFHRWLQLATGCAIESADAIARRFRRGEDYTLATGYDGKPRLELNLGFTPTSGWGDVDDDDDDDDDEAAAEPAGGEESEAEVDGEESEAEVDGEESEAEVDGEEYESEADGEELEAEVDVNAKSKTEPEAEADGKAKSKAEPEEVDGKPSSNKSKADPDANEKAEANGTEPETNGNGKVKDEPVGGKSKSEAEPDTSGTTEAENKADTDADGTEPETNGKAEAEANADGTEPEQTNGKAEADGLQSKTGDEEKAKAEPEQPEAVVEAADVGGHEVYMAGEDDANDDAAIYKSSGDEDNILFFQAAAWNKLTLVLRDSDTLKFVKYVSRSARGDRWDVAASFDVAEAADADADAGQGAAPPLGESDNEPEFNGFPDSDDSDSD